MSPLPLIVFSLAAALILEQDQSAEPDQFGASNGDDSLSGLRRSTQELEEVSSTTVLDRLEVLEPAVGKLVRSTVHQAPSWIFDAVTDVAIEAAKKDISQGVARDVEALRREGRIENLKELDQALGALERILDRAPQVKRLTNRALEALDQHGILGDHILQDLAIVLAAVGTGAAFATKQVSEGGLQLVFPFGKVSLDNLGRFQTVLRLRSPAWPRSAIEVALGGKTALPGKRFRRSRLDPSELTMAKLQFHLPVIRKTRTGKAPVMVSPYVATGQRGEEKRAGLEIRGRFG